VTRLFRSSGLHQHERREPLLEAPSAFCSLRKLISNPMAALLTTVLKSRVGFFQHRATCECRSLFCPSFAHGLPLEWPLALLKAVSGGGGKLGPMFDRLMPGHSRRRSQPSDAIALFTETLAKAIGERCRGELSPRARSGCHAIDMRPLAPGRQCPTARPTNAGRRYGLLKRCAGRMRALGCRSLPATGGWSGRDAGYGFRLSPAPGSN
jgi:hypothetical protein